MRRALFTWTTAFVIGAVMVSVAMAQPRPKEIARLDYFLEHHPQIAKQLAADPRLADDPNFLAQHQGLKNMLIAHPSMRDQISTAAKRYAEDSPEASKAAEASTPEAQPSAGTKP